MHAAKKKEKKKRRNGREDALLTFIQKEAKAKNSKNRTLKILQKSKPTLQKATAKGYEECIGSASSRGSEEVLSFHGIDDAEGVKKKDNSSKKRSRRKRKEDKKTSHRPCAVELEER